MNCSLQNMLEKAAGMVWGWPLMILLIGTGAWLTFLLGSNRVRPRI
ncbi:MAG: hypothetical protein PHG96_02210 [Kiritimatiellae bacterium]|nr:hypothetical protein [Kiritimatiellia bacterium]MDD4622247.1 hypothetical protein [Kiritimatiellia bacterium]